MKNRLPILSYMTGLFLGLLGWCGAWVGGGNVWAQTALQKPTFLSQPPRAIVEGALWKYKIDLGGVGWRVEKATFALRKGPSSLKLISLGQRGCCRWWALLSWFPEQKDVGKHDIEIEVTSSDGKVFKHAFAVEVVNRNDPPSIRSVPPARAREGALYLYQVQATDPDPVKDVLEYRLLSAPAGMSINLKGEIRWTPKSNQVGLHEVAVEVIDHVGATAQQSFVLSVLNVRQAPQFVSQPLLGAVQGRPYVYRLRAEDPDSGARLSFRLNSSIRGMKLRSDGTLTWVPSQAGRVSVSVEVVDETGLQSTQQWDITVVQKNKSPEVLSRPPVSVLQGQTYRYNLQVQDDEKDNLSYSLVRAPAGLQLKVSVSKNSAEVVWSPKASDVGVHWVWVRVDDQKGGVAWDRFQVRVIDVNDAPRFVSQPRTKMLEGQTYLYRARALDADGDVVRYALNQAPAGMQIDATTGEVRWKPSYQRSAQTYSVVVVAMDQKGASSQQKFQLELFKSNAIPQWTSAPTVRAQQNNVYTYQAKVVDVDAGSDEIRFRLVEHPMAMQIDLSSGLVRWIPGAKDVGQHQVVIEALDAKGGVARQAFVLHVKDENDAPVVISKPVRTAQVGRLYLYRIQVVDADSLALGDTLSFSVKGPEGMKLEHQDVQEVRRPGAGDVLGSQPSCVSLRASALLSWTPKVEDAGRGKFAVQVQVSDGRGGAATHSFTITVGNESNQLPTIKKSEQIDVEEGKPLRYRLEVSDPDKDALLVELLGGPEGLVLDTSSLELRWTPRRRHVGTWRVEVRVNDQRGGVLWWSLGVKVKPKQHAPQIISIPNTRAVAELRYLYSLRGVDANSDDRRQLRWILKQGPPGMSLDPQRGVLSWSPSTKDIGRHTVQVELRDKASNTSSQEFVLVVAGSNQPPQIVSPSPQGQIKEGERFSHAVVVLDPNVGDRVRFRLLKSPPGMTVGRYSGLIQWIPREGQAGRYSVTLEAVDREGAAVQQSFSLQVTDVNAAPVIRSLPGLGATVGQLYVYSLVLDDPENDSIQSIQLLDSPIALQTVNQMRVDLAKKQLQWLPGKEHKGGHFLVVVEVKDKRGGVSLQSFVVHVVESNNAPTWRKQPPSGSVTIAERQLYTVVLAAEDRDNDILSYDLLSAPQGMLLGRRTGQVAWVPLSSQVGSHIVVVAVRDGRGGTLQAKWTLRVRNSNNAPRIVSKPSTLAHVGRLFSYRVVALDEDPQDKLHFTLQQAPTGMVMDRAQGRITWTPLAADVGRSFLVVVRVVDSNGAFDSQVFRVRVAAVNRAPKIVSSPLQQALEGRLYSYQVRSFDPDSGDTVEYLLVSGPSGMVLHSQTGWLRWMPGNADVGVVEVSVLARDEKGATHTQTFVIAVSNQNNPPRFLSTPCTRAAVNTPYKCILVVEDIDPNTQKLSVESVRVPAGWSAQMSSSGSGSASSRSVFLVALSWNPQPRDIGSHLVELRVSDGVSSDRLLYTLEVRSNEDVPIAIPGDDQNIPPGELKLDGRNSRDAKGLSEGLTFEWRFVQGPEEVVLDNPGRAEVKAVLRKAGAYVFSLVVSKGGRSSSPGFVRVVVKNLKPSAHIWAPWASQVGQTISLDATASADANNDGLNYQWKLAIDGKEQPDWSARTPRVRFSPKVSGLHRFTLTTTEDLPSFERSGSTSYAVEVVVHDADRKQFLPHAVILSPKVGNVGQSLSLDGSRSRSLSSPEGRDLVYQWSIVEGPSKAKIASPSKSVTSFIAESPGYYVVGLVVRNGKHSSRQALWGISVQGNSAETQLPVARFVSLYGVLNSWIQLDASRSTGPGGSQLQFSWSQRSGATADLRNPKTAQPSFFVLHPSTYEFQLRVRGEGPQSAPVLVRALVNQPNNKPPVANAGSSLTGRKGSRTAGQLVELDGTKSSDPDKTSDRLVYRWKQVSGFPVALNSPSEAVPNFVPLTYGILRFSLEVFDGIAWSRASYVDVVVNSEQNKVPFADAGADLSVRFGQSVMLDGTKSYDEDPDDKLVYQWRLIAPEGRQVQLNLTDPAHPSFTASDAGISRYVFGLVVDDGKSRSLEDTVEVRVRGTNQPPTAQIQVSGNALVGEEFILDGSSSQDPDNDKLTYVWKQLAGPPLELGDLEKSTLRIRATKASTYRFQLQVNDGLAQSAPASIVVQIKEVEPKPEGCGCQASASTPGWLGWLFLLAVWWRRRKLVAAKGWRSRES